MAARKIFQSPIWVLLAVSVVVVTALYLFPKPQPAVAVPTALADPIVILSQQITLLSAQVADLAAQQAVEVDTIPTPAAPEITESIPTPAEVVKLGVPFRTPVECLESFSEESAWLICEPGVILDNAAAWVIPSVDTVHFANVPEGGFTYFSMGEGVIAIDGVALELPGEHGLNYLVVFRGRIDDGLVDSDLNETAEVTDFVPGHAIWSIMPPGAYVSKDWFRQQLVVSTTTGGTNCGATGCSLVKVVLFDVDSRFKQVFDVHAGSLDNWTLLAAN